MSARDERSLAETAVQSADEVLRATADAIAKRCAEDPAAAFDSEAIETIAALRAADPSGFERLRARLKAVGVRVTALDRAVAAAGGGDSRTPTQADALVKLAGEAELFHAPDGTAYADVEVNGHRETWPVRSRGFRRWLCRRFYEESGGRAPNAEALAAALNVIEARAAYEGPERPVFVRVAEHEGRIFLDLGDATWRAVEITARGWWVVERPPVRFRRAAGMFPLPEPQRGGRVEDLRRFINVSAAHFTLIAAWLLAALRGRGPYPVLALAGEQGSGKSTTAAMLRALLDPNAAALRSFPREERDLFIAATNGHVLAFDNISNIPAALSDAFCRIATGGGFAVRQLYTDRDEIIFDAMRPILLTSIEDVITRPDLADRALFVALEAIPEDRRRPEAELWAAFEAARPAILGALLDAVAEGLRRLPDVRLPGLPRMADFALWATACETAFQPEGTFMQAYAVARETAVETAIEADPVAEAVRGFMADRTGWTGTAADLLEALTPAAGERAVRSKAWPATPRALSGRLRRLAPILRRLGIDVDFRRTRGGTREIILSRAPESAGTRPSPPSPLGEKAPSLKGLAGDGRGDGRGALVTQNGGAVTQTVEPSRFASPPDPLGLNDFGGGDGRDAKITALSASRERRPCPRCAGHGCRWCRPE